MLLRFPITLQQLKPNSVFLGHQFRFSTAHIVEDPQILTSSLKISNFYDHLQRICLQECKKIQARQLFDQMPERIKLSLKTGKTIHCQSLRLGMLSDGKLTNTILDLYAKCGHTGYAEKLFFRLHRPDEMAWNSIMVMNSRKRLFKDVQEGFGLMWSSGVMGSRFSFAIVLSACAKLMDVELGKEVHCAVTKLGLDVDAYCEGALIDMYAKCGHLILAKRIFDNSVAPDAVSWTAMISGFSQTGLTTEAMELFVQMQKVGHVPDHVVFVTVLSACIRQGKLDDAACVFSRMVNPNVVAWNVMISGHAKGGKEEEAVQLFKKMVKAGVEPTRSTIGSVLSAIAAVSNRTYGLQVHCWAVKRGLDSNVYAGSSLVSMYSKCKRMDAAKAVFDGLEEKNDVLWNALLGGYAQNGYALEVLELFFNMKVSGCQPDEFTYTSVLSSCACLQDMDTGRQLHAVLIKNKCGDNLYVQNALVDMYAKCSDLSNAMKLFERIKNRDNVSWNAMIVGYVQEEQEQEALCMFRRMMSEGIAPDEVSLASILSGMAKLQYLCVGMQLHCFLIKYGLEKGLYAAGSLIDMYCKCSVVEAAAIVFSGMPERSVVCVNALISGYAEQSLDEAVSTFKCMISDGLQPSEVTFATLLEACSGNSHLHLGKQLHSFVMKLGLSFIDEYLVVSLLGMYMSAQRNTDAVSLFSELPDPKSTIIWTVLISGSTQNDYFKEALVWYCKMRGQNVMPDQATFASVLRACSGLASLEDGRKIHSSIIQIGYDKDELTESVLVDMYAKCGDMNSSTQVFQEMVNRKDVISWNSMIVGYAKNGYAKHALAIFDEMKQAGIKPDEVTFLGALTACSHAGMVPEGRALYDSMINDHGIQPRADHCACMVDLLGRWGFLQEAESFIENMTSAPDSMIWATYLSACRLHGDDIRGQCAAEKLFELEPHSSSPYVLLSHIHAASGNWDGVNYVREMMTRKRIKKFVGSSKISMDMVG